ncbi:hypothetical protein BU23DRAFT_549702 [Bimuria novae-zelandiae CBS 107.79]|uniref:Uncharacterized protein n=1 Tax=Bimuria novae-zelandiae CBS 107.79 TaxID=1447943 RepID=A0A6A5VMS2_9PLEO|nr:hypothetical protein BU23DRAFT_549702 [Bimuria novae-zelandiae CBS 107.79]
MIDYGKFDVIQLKAGHLRFIGRQRGGISPSEIEGRLGLEGRPYILANAGFFDLGNLNPICPAAVNGGATIQDPSPPVQRYESNYVKVAGDDKSYIHTGPPLPMTGNISFRHPKWTYVVTTPTGRHRLHDQVYMLGSLAHASVPKERLGLVKMRNGDYYLFVYTARDSRFGKNVRGFRDLMELWFESGFHATAFSPEDVLQSVNLDGGASIHVSWTDGNGAIKRIAKGHVRGEIPTESGKRVANLVQIFPSST